MPAPRKTGEPAQAANRQRLSHFTVKNLKPQARPYVVWDTVQRGLAISVQPSGHAAWKCVYSFHGRPRWLHLADTTAIGLADARKLAYGAMHRVAEGKDPASERRAERSADSFDDLATRYRKYSERKNKSWKQADALVRKYLLPKWGKLPAAGITRADVKALISHIEAPILVNQISASASAVFAWAIREDVVGITVNPCVGVERNATKSRERVLSDSEVPLFWSAFNDEGEIGAALKVILLAGQRPSEVVHMHAEHLADGWWSLPGDPVPALSWPGTKNGASHRVWLSTAVQEIIGADHSSGPIFTGITRHLLATTMREICKRLGVARATPHDLRRTNGTLITSLGFGRDGMNRVQNHKEGGIGSVYDRFEYAEENKKIMEAVTGRIMTLIDGNSPNILAFKQKKSS
jgi:integrase